MQALGLIISNSFVAGVIAQDIVDYRDAVCVCGEQARCLSVRMFRKC